jgi:competence protein ComEA
MKTLKTLVASLLLGCALHAVCADAPLDLNAADAATLADVMVGVGPAKAEAIVEYRAAHGPFSSVDDLALVKGIGSATIEQNRARLTVSKPAP